MTALSYNNWHSLSDTALTEQIGDFVKHHRLEQNKTQDKLAHAAGISRSTLSLLERGKTVTLATLIQVLRVLDKLHVMDFFTVQQSISPLAMATLEQGKRKRARNNKTNDLEETDW
ncbi:MAG: helix-turn-helix transcriptional regulator [Chlorobium sp.]|jgi:transcriptional regulator with XRE-family HTH domain|nr:MAG: helix-turn-helix transcriptional regulator [Chlorobium sp.]